MNVLFLTIIMLLASAIVILAGFLVRYLKFIVRRIPGLASTYVLMGTVLIALLLSLIALLVPSDSVVGLVESLLATLNVLGNTLCATIIIVLMGGRSKRMIRVIALLFLIPALSFVLSVLSTVTHFVVESVTRRPSGYGFDIVSGPGMDIIQLGGITVILVAFAYVIYSMRRRPGRSKVLLWLFIGTVLIPRALAAILNIIPYLRPMHIDALASFVSAVVLVSVFFGYLHTARDMAVLNTREGYVVFDRFGECVDINARAREFFLNYAAQPRPQFSDLARLLGAEEAKILTTSEFELGQGKDKKYFLLTNFRISNTVSRYAGDGFLIREVTELKAQVDKFSNLANEDPLTGIKNRRYFDEHIGTVLVPGKSFSLMILDIDFFKDVNDSFGHLVGDEVLYQLCRRCSRALRARDLFCRLGGEEFVILVENKHPATGLEFAKRIFRVIATDPFATSKGNLAITVSIGCYSAVVAPDDTPALWLETADKLLYQAKSNGRNRIETNL
jgi:diguanylate cyclase (GGDEF)-like protein